VIQQGDRMFMFRVWPRAVNNASACPLWSRTIKHADCSSADQGGGKRRAGGCATPLKVEVWRVCFGISRALSEQSRGVVTA